MIGGISTWIYTQRMNKRFFLLFLLSLGATLAGLIMVVFFTYFYIVPFRQATEVRMKKCHVSDFHNIIHDERTCRSVNGSNIRLDGRNNLFKGDNVSCLVISVMYEGWDGTWSKAILVDMDTKSGYFEIKSDPKEARCCPGCTSSQYKPANTINSNNHHPPYKLDTTIMSHKSSVKDITSCTLRFPDNNQHYAIHLYQPLYCMFKSRNYKQTGKMLNHVVTINIITWPTLLFIIGFVGLFFSCIQMQYDPYKDKTEFRTVVVGSLTEEEHIMATTRESQVICL